MLEACLAGETVVANQQLGVVPAKAGRPRPTAAGKPVREADAGQGGEGRVRPGTFLNRAVAAVNPQIRRWAANVKKSETAEQAAYRLALARRPHVKGETASKAAGELEQQSGYQQLEQTRT